MNNVTRFEVKIHPHRASTGTIEKAIRESFRAVIGADPGVFVVQKDDRTLEVSVITKGTES